MALRNRSTLLGAGAMAVGVLWGGGALRSAHAEWQVTVLVDSSGSQSAWDSVQRKMVPDTSSYVNYQTAQVQSGPTYSTNSRPLSSEGREGAAADIDLTVTFKLQLDWVDNPYYARYGLPFPEPDKHVAMKVWGSTAVVAFPGGTAPTAQTAGNATATTRSITRTDSLGQNQPGVVVEANGKLLVQRGNSEGLRQLVIGPFTAKYKAKATAALLWEDYHGTPYSRDPRSYTTGSLSLNAQFDNRRLQLKRAGARDEKFTTRADGSLLTEGHGRWSYKRRVDTSVDGILDYEDRPANLKATIGVVAPGSWSDQGWYTWSHEGPTTTDVSTTVNLPDSGALDNSVGLERPTVTTTGSPGTVQKVPPGWSGLPSQGGPNPLIVNYQVTDTADGTTANAQYQLTLHDKFENWRANPNIPIKRGHRYTPAKPTRGIWQGHPTLNSGVSWTQTTAVGIGIEESLTGSFNVGTLFQLGGSYATSESKEFGVENAFQVDIPKGMMVYVHIHHDWPVLNYLVDEYDEGGQVKNPARSDGSWNQKWNDTKNVVVSRTTSNPFAYGDFNMDGYVDQKDDAVN